MIRHIVFYRFRNEEDLLNAQRVLLSMDGKIDLIRSIEVGRDFINSPRSFHLALNMTFDSRESLKAYQEEKYHVEVVKKYMSTVVLESASVDYEA